MRYHHQSPKRPMTPRSYWFVPASQHQKERATQTATQVAWSDWKHFVAVPRSNFHVLAVTEVL